MKSNAVSSQRSVAFSTRKIVMVGLLSALAYVLMLVHLPFKFLGFLEFEFSDIPAVIAALQFGPFAGVLVEFVKNLIKALTASSTGMIGELANFLIGSAYIIPLGFMYKIRNQKKLRKDSLNGTVSKKTTSDKLHMVLMFAVATICFAAAGALLNYFVMLPLYAKLFGGMETIVGIAASSLPAVKDLNTLVFIGITPFNIVKGIYVSIIGYYTYRLLRGRIF